MFSSGGGNPEQHNIKAAVMHHAYTHTYQAPTVPFLAFTGTTDVIAPASMTHSFYNKAASTLPRGYVNKAGAGHMEPNWNPADITQFTVAWFKVFLDHKPQDGGVDYEALLFGSGRDSLCHGGDGSMKECALVPATSSRFAAQSW